MSEDSKAFCYRSRGGVVPKRGTGRFQPKSGARLAIGQVGKLEEVEEERVEVTCDSRPVRDLVAAVVSVHLYEEAAMDVWAMDVWAMESWK
jgi:hypothetical protein